VLGGPTDGDESIVSDVFDDLDSYPYKERERGHDFFDDEPAHPEPMSVLSRKSTESDNSGDGKGSNRTTTTKKPVPDDDDVF
jgi:hypothetical protein